MFFVNLSLNLSYSKVFFTAFTLEVGKSFCHSILYSEKKTVCQYVVFLIMINVHFESI